MRAFERQDSDLNAGNPILAHMHFQNHSHGGTGGTNKSLRQLFAEEKRKYRHLFMAGTLVSFIVLAVLSTLILYGVGRTDVANVLRTATRAASLEITEMKRTEIERRLNFTRNMGSYLAHLDVVKIFNDSGDINSVMLRQLKFASETAQINSISLNARGLYFNISLPLDVGSEVALIQQQRTPGCLQLYHLNMTSGLRISGLGDDCLFSIPSWKANPIGALQDGNNSVIYTRDPGSATVTLVVPQKASLVSFDLPAGVFHNHDRIPLGLWQQTRNLTVSSVGSILFPNFAFNGTTFLSDKNWTLVATPVLPTLNNSVTTHMYNDSSAAFEAVKSVFKNPDQVETWVTGQCANSTQFESACVLPVRGANLQIVTVFPPVILKTISIMVALTVTLCVLGLLVSILLTFLTYKRLKTLEDKLSMDPSFVKVLREKRFVNQVRSEMYSIVIIVAIFATASAALWISFKAVLGAVLSHAHLERMTHRTLFDIHSVVSISSQVSELLATEVAALYDKNCTGFNPINPLDNLCDRASSVIFPRSLLNSMMQIRLAYKELGYMTLAVSNTLAYLSWNSSLLTMALFDNTTNFCLNYYVLSFDESSWDPSRPAFKENCDYKMKQRPFYIAAQGMNYSGLRDPYLDFGKEFYLAPYITPIRRESGPDLLSAVICEFPLLETFRPILSKATSIDVQLFLDLTKNMATKENGAPMNNLTNGVSHAYLATQSGFVLGWDFPDPIIKNTSSYVGLGENTTSSLIAETDPAAPDCVRAAAQFSVKNPPDATSANRSWDRRVWLQVNDDMVYMPGGEFLPGIFLTNLTSLSEHLTDPWQLTVFLPYWLLWSPAFSHNAISLIILLFLIMTLVSSTALSGAFRRVFAHVDDCVIRDAETVVQERSLRRLQSIAGSEATSEAPIVLAKIPQPLLEIIVLHLDNAFHDRPLRKKGLQTNHRRLFQLIHSAPYRGANTILIVFMMFFVFIEEGPMLQKTPLYALVMEVICFGLLLVDSILFCRDRLLEKRYWIEARIVPFVAGLMTLDVLISLGLRLSNLPSFRYSRLLRPVYALLRLEDVREVAKRVVRAMLQTVDMLILLLLFIISSTVIGIVLFQKYYNPSQTSFGFYNISEGLITQFNIMNQEAMPDILSTVLQYRWAVIIFLVCFFIFSFLFFVPALIVLFYESYKDSTKALLIRKRQDQIVNLLAAFDLIDAQGKEEIASSQFQTVMQEFLSRSVRSSMQKWAQKMAMEKFIEIDRDASGKLDKMEFCDVFRKLKEALDNSVDTGTGMNEFQRTLVDIFFTTDMPLRDAKPTDYRLNMLMSQFVVFVVMGQMLFNTSFGDIYLGVFKDIFVMFEAISIRNTLTVKTVINGLFLLCQVIELVIKAIVWAPRGFWRLGAFNRLDLFAVSISVVLLLTSIPYSDDTVIKRLPWCLPALRVFTIFPSNMFLLKTFISVLRSIGAVAIVTFLLMYVYAVIGMWAFSGIVVQPIDPDKDFSETFNFSVGFESPSLAFLTLFQLLFGFGYKLVAYPIVESTNWFGHVFFVSYSFLSNMLVLNLVVGVVIDAFQFRVSISNMEQLDLVLMKRTGVDVTDKTVCSICGKGVEDSDSLCHFPCRYKHVFHTMCILHYEYDRGTCPTCRLFDKQKNIRQTYSGKAEELIFREVVFHEVSVNKVERKEAQALEDVRQECETLCQQIIGPRFQIKNSLRLPLNERAQQRVRASVIKIEEEAKERALSRLRLAVRSTRKFRDAKRGSVVEATDTGAGVTPRPEPVRSVDVPKHEDEIQPVEDRLSFGAESPRPRSDDASLQGDGIRLFPLPDLSPRVRRLYSPTFSDLRFAPDEPRLFGIPDQQPSRPSSPGFEISGTTTVTTLVRGGEQQATALIRKPRAQRHLKDESPNSEEPNRHPPLVPLFQWC